MELGMVLIEISSKGYTIELEKRELKTEKDK